MKAKFKKLLSVFLSVVMLLSITAGIDLSAYAETSGDFEYQLFNDGTAEITEYTGSATNLTIPSKIGRYTVTSIGEWAFDNCTSLKSIIIPNSVTSIGSSFYDCTSLTSITVDSENANYSSKDGVLFNKTKTVLIRYPIGNSRSTYDIPNSVTSIGLYAFEYCKSLTSVTIPNSVKSIGGYVFCECTSLTSVTIPNSVKSIGGYTFYDCTSLTSVTIPDSVTSIGDYAFRNCESLTSVTIPDSVTSIGDYAFEYCESLTSVKIPDSVTSIGDYAFEYCTSLTSITVDSGNANYLSKEGVLFNKTKTVLIQYPIGNSRPTYDIPNSVTSIGSSAFYGCKSLTSVKIPNSVTSLGSSAFEYCTSLTSVTIGNSVTSIGDSAFWGCSSLTSVTIPNSVTSIGDCAFEYCTSLTSVTIPDSVTSIGEGAFEECESLTDVYYSGSQDQWNNISIGINNWFLKNAIIHYNCNDDDSEDTGEDTGNENDFESISTGEIKTVDITTEGEYKCFLFEPKESGNYTFRAIGDYDTYGSVYDSNFDELISDDDGNGDNNFSIRYYFEAGVQYYLVARFYEGGETGSFNVQLIGDRSSEEPEEPEESYYYDILDDGTAEITDYKGSATDLTIPSKIDGYIVTSIGEYAFCDCTSLTSVTIGNSVTSIGEDAFQNCTRLTSVTIGNSVTSIGYGAFNWCESLKNVTIPDSVTNIGDNAFYKCTSIKSVTIGNSVTSIGDCAFYECTNLTSVTIPNSVTSIGGSAFCDCTSLTSVTIPNSVTSIGRFAFANCTRLTSVTIGNSVTSIGRDAFAFCTSLKNVTIPDSVTSMGGYAFYNCTRLTSVTIGNSVTSIGEQAFGVCYELEDVYYCGTKTQWNNISIGSGNDYLLIAKIHYNSLPPCTNHTPATAVKENVKKATCTAAGSYDSVVYCSVCNHVINRTKKTVAKISSIKLSGTSYIYNGKTKTPSVTVKDSKGKTLVKNTDYTVSYASGRKYVGKYSVKITFKGKYSGTKTLYFTIKPKATSISSLKAGSKKFTVKWYKRSTQTSGYQVQYSTSSKFTSPKTVTISKTGTTSKTVSKLKAKKKYYVRVRTYKTVNGTKYYSSWSKAKYVTTKS